MKKENINTEMEDEECLPENSSLNVYLRNLGYSDVQVTKNISQNPSGIKFEVSKSQTKWPHVETVDEDVIDQIGIIISTQLLFEEDVSNLEKLLSNFKVVKSGMLTYMFRGLFGVAIIFVGLCLYWIIGYFAFLIVSSFYAYNAAYYLRRKYFFRIHLKKLSTIIQGNFMLLKKTLKFIEENSLVESQCTSLSKSAEFLKGFDFYKSFKNDFTLSLNKMNEIFVKSTQNLIQKVPLYDYIENPEYYLCNNLKKDYESVDLSKLYEIYLLLQSEFLQRLILSLIPNVKISSNDNFNEINKILTETCVGLLKIKKVINKKFKFLFLNGIHSPKARVEFKLPKKNGLSGNIYMDEFLLNIHDVSKNFQNLLLKCRILEENIKSKEKFESLEGELTKMQSELITCQRNINDCLILLKRSNAMTVSEKVSVQDVKEINNSCEKVNKVEVGCTDLDPKVEDEIFEMFLANEKEDRNYQDEDDWELGNRLQKKREKEICKNVMKELKVKLVDKAKSWKKREREVLKRKGVINTSEDVSDSDSRASDDETAGELNSENQKIVFEIENDADEKFNLGNIPLPPSLIFQNQNNFQLSEKENEVTNSTETFDIDTSTQDDEFQDEAENTNFENTQSPVGPFKTDFFNDLNKAREKIFKSSQPVNEEFFCDYSDDDSS